MTGLEKTEELARTENTEGAEGTERTQRKIAQIKNKKLSSHREHGGRRENTKKKCPD